MVDGLGRLLRFAFGQFYIPHLIVALGNFVINLPDLQSSDKVIWIL